MNSIKTGIGETPLILSVDIVKELWNFIESKAKEKWISILWLNKLQIFHKMYGHNLLYITVNNILINSKLIAILERIIVPSNKLSKITENYIIIISIK